MSDDLTAFLRARLDEDEAAANAATSGPWLAHEYIDYDCDFEATIGTGQGTHERTNVVGHGYEGGGVQTMSDARHIARHDPARVLREVEAKRRLVAEYAEVSHNDGAGSYEYGYGWADGLGLAVRCAAAAYPDHPDYRPEWDPGA